MPQPPPDEPAKPREGQAREAQTLLEIERQRAARRKQATLKQNSTVVENVPPREDVAGKARDKVGEALGVSGKTVPRGYGSGRNGG